VFTAALKHHLGFTVLHRPSWWERGLLHPSQEPFFTLGLWPQILVFQASEMHP